VVDDHELLRAGTRQILEDAAGFTVVGRPRWRHGVERGVRAPARRRPRRHQAPTTNGIDLARQIIADYPDTTVLILSAYDDEHYVRAALAAGVAGYLLKTTPSDELVRSIRAACEGSTLFDRGLTGRARRPRAHRTSTCRA